MIVSKDNCKGCPVFEDNEFQENMIENDVCSKREMLTCPKDNEVK